MHRPTAGGVAGRRPTHLLLLPTVSQGLLHIRQTERTGQCVGGGGRGCCVCGRVGGWGGGAYDTSTHTTNCQQRLTSHTSNWARRCVWGEGGVGAGGGGVLWHISYYQLSAKAYFTCVKLSAQVRGWGVGWGWGGGVCVCGRGCVLAIRLSKSIFPWLFYWGKISMKHVENVGRIIVTELLRLLLFWLRLASVPLYVLESMGVFLNVREIIISTFLYISPMFWPYQLPMIF